LSVAQQAHTKQQQQNGKSKQKPITKKQEQKNNIILTVHDTGRKIYHCLKTKRV